MFVFFSSFAAVWNVDARRLARADEALNSVVYDQLRYPDLEELEEAYRAANAMPIKRAVRLMRLG